MINTSYLTLIQHLNTFCNSHREVARFSSDFTEQLQNFGSSGTSYPIVYAAPTSLTFLDSANTNDVLNLFTMTIWCVDLIQEDRSNINTILNSTSLILNDLFKWLVQSPSPQIAIKGNASLRPINNWTLETVAGWAMTLTFEVESYTRCDIPFSTYPTP